MTLSYRPEVDGLRAIAVVPVLLFHAGVGAFHGGYVGVDVFFVLSGYLITSIIRSELQAGTFTLAGFYERRARRILPALFVVVAACIGPAWWLMAPHQLKDFSQSLVAVSAFASNVLFWLESGYFEASAELKPLLHTWSLAVEEQYYVVFPLLLLALRRLGARPTAAVVATIAIASLALAQWSSTRHPGANFYLLHTRAWELLAGALVALKLGGAGTPPVRGADAWGWVGLALVLGAVFAFDHTTPFPSLWPAVPVLGTVLLVRFARADAGVGRLLASRPLVGLGLISYSLYLWHQPLLAFLRIRRGESELNALTIGLFLLLSLALAAASYRWVERPFRSRSRFSRGSIFALSLAGIVGFGALGLAGHRSDGFLAHKLAQVPEAKRALLVQVEAESRRRAEVVARHAADLQRPGFDVASGRRRVLVIGDSVGEDLATALAEHGGRFPRHELRFLKFDEECMDGFDVVGGRPRPRGDRCDGKLTALLANDLLLQSDLTVVTHLWKNDLDFGRVRDFLSGLQRVSREVLLLGGGGFIDISSVAFQIAMREGVGSQQQVDAAVAASRREEFDLGNAAVASLARELSMRYADRHDLYCGEGAGCRILWLDGRTVLWDAAHLTVFGMEQTARRVAELGWLEPPAGR